MESNLNSISVFQSLSKWKWHLIGVAAVAGILAAIFSSPMFITPKYKSTATVYPAFLFPFSSETPTEQMLQIFKSTEIRDDIVKTFDLYKHYDIDTTVSKTYKTLVNDAYNDNVDIKQTEYESVEITVLDEDPALAARMADSICAYMNYKARNIQHKQAYDVYKIHADRYFEKGRSIDSAGEVLRKMRLEYGLLDVKSQTKEFTKAYLKNGSPQAKKMLDILSDKGTEYYALSTKFDGDLKSYGDLRIKYEEAIKDTGKILMYTNFVSKPVASDKKSYPVRWLIVAIAIAGSLTISFIVLLMFGNSSKLKA